MIRGIGELGPIPPERKVTATPPAQEAGDALDSQEPPVEPQNHPDTPTQEVAPAETDTTQPTSETPQPLYDKDGNLVETPTQLGTNIDIER